MTTSVLSRDTRRLLLGPGPCNPHPTVLAAQALPLVGHLDPLFTTLMDEAHVGLSKLFGVTNNGDGDSSNDNKYVTFAASGTGSAGMELLAVNLFERGDVAVVGVNGVFGGRIAECLTKMGIVVETMEVPFGQGFTPSDIRERIDAVAQRGMRVAAVWLVLAETSTGYYQTQVQECVAEARKSVRVRVTTDNQGLPHTYNLEKDSDKSLAPSSPAPTTTSGVSGDGFVEYSGGDTLFLLDCVTALGGSEVKLADWGVDAAFSGTQKCLGVPPGLAPIALGPRAFRRLAARTTPVASWYFDVAKLLAYWAKPGSSGKRTYHHTAPISSCFGLHEGVRLLVDDEGIEAVRARYARIGSKLSKALLERGFRYAVAAEENRLPQLHCVFPPDGVDEAKLRSNLMAHEQIEIGAGLGSLAGRVVRIGMMGANADDNVVQILLDALDKWMAASTVPLAKA